MFIWIKFAILICFSSLFPKRLMFNLAISCLTPNLLWFMALTFQIHMQYCSLQHWTYFHHQSHPPLGIVFTLAPSLYSFWSYFSTLPQEHLGAPTDFGSSSFSVIPFCLFILFMGFLRQEYWSGLPFPSPVAAFCQNSLPWPVCLG